MTRRDFIVQGSAPLVAAGAAFSQTAPPAASGEFRRGGMLFRPLGTTGLTLSLLGFGSHTDPAYRVDNGPRGTALNAEGQVRRDRQIARALDLGITFMDIYQHEGQWEPMARSVKGRRDKLVLSTAHQTRDYIGRDLDRAAKLFGGWIDLYRFVAAAVDDETLRNWDALRKAKEAGKVRAIGIATHDERTMLDVIDKLEGLDYLFFPYNFIHARAEYSRLIPVAMQKGIGMIAMKPVASGSIATLDPLAPAGPKPEFANFELWRSGNRPVLPAAVAELTKSLDRLPGETLCMAAMRFVYSKPFISCALAGMFDEKYLEENYKALARYQEMSKDEHAALDAARAVAAAAGPSWLPEHYRWLEEQWRA